VYSKSKKERYAIGELLGGKYRLERLIGKGGMGLVYAAHHELLHQRVAIKLLLTDARADDGTVTRFLNEARAAARIPSEHVVRVLDVGLLEEGRPYLVMEYLEGRDLAHLLESRGRLTARESVDYVLEAIEAVAQAHALGIVHRDLKPSNLFLAEGADGTRAVKVLDFGIAKAFGKSASVAAAVTTQGLLGSPAYMAPEYVRSAKSFEPRSDMWAFGVILYELLTGSLPFRGDNVGEILVAILEKTPTPLAAIVPGLPPALVEVVERCMRRDVNERFANLAELAEALAPFATRRAQSIAHIRTSMKVLEDSHDASALGGARRVGAEDPTALAPAAPGAQTNDSWSGASPTVRRPRKSRARAFAVLVMLAMLAAGVAVVQLVRRGPSVASVALSASVASSAASTAMPTVAIAPAPPTAPVAPIESASAPIAVTSGSPASFALSSARPRHPPAPAKPAPRANPTASPAPQPTLARDRL
jgi:serine/threonine protein kinase